MILFRKGWVLHKQGTLMKLCGCLIQDFVLSLQIGYGINQTLMVVGYYTSLQQIATIKPHQLPSNPTGIYNLRFYIKPLPEARKAHVRYLRGVKQPKQSGEKTVFLTISCPTYLENFVKTVHSLFLSHPPTLTLINAPTPSYSLHTPFPLTQPFPTSSSTPTHP